MTLVEEKYCEGCGEQVKVYRMRIIGGPSKGKEILSNVGCKCEDLRMAREAMANYERMKLERLKEQFDRHSLINPRLQKATLDGYEPKNESQAVAKKAVIDFIANFSKDEPKNLLFFGSYGVGKSHLAKVITDGVMEKGFTTIFISVPKLLRKVRSTYSRDSEIREDDIFSMLESVDLLVLDDLGAERKSVDSKNEWADERIFDLIDSRQGLSTIYTTNFPPEDLFEMFGERNFSRIMNEDTDLIEVRGENHRLADLY